MSREKDQPAKPAEKDPPGVPPPLVEGEDYYLEGGRYVFTDRYHLKRGYCCNSGCRHCPFGNKK